MKPVSTADVRACSLVRLRWGSAAGQLLIVLVAVAGRRPSAARGDPLRARLAHRARRTPRSGCGWGRARRDHDRLDADRSRRSTRCCSRGFST
ncbi:MAG: hypothetical protein MZV64_30680 [Ignavibacteriales bacterium]|nr:hypothetical protein [Ignavibacteriales bacterium]